MTSDVTLSRGLDVTPSQARSSRGRTAELRRRRWLDRISASEVEAPETDDE
jgi:hypothetical protein